MSDIEFRSSFTVKNDATVEINVKVKIPDKELSETDREELLHRFAEESHYLYLKIGNALNNINKIP